MEGQIVITDSRVRAWTKLLPRAQPSEVTISIAGTEEDVPRLASLFKALQDCEMKLWFENDYRHPGSSGMILDEALYQFFQRCRVTRFKGQVSGRTLAVLPESMRRLELSVDDDEHSQDVLIQMSTLTERLPQLEYLKVHVAAGVQDLVPLPPVEYLYLVLTNMTVESACRAARALLPTTGRG